MVKKNQRKQNQKKQEEKKTKPKKGLKIALILGAIIVALAGAGFGVKTYLTRTTVVTETAQLPEETRSFSGYLKEYLVYRIEMKNLTGYKFREMTNEQMLEELIVLKNGFSKVSRGVEDRFEESEFKGIAGIMENDSVVYLRAIRELRAILAREFEDEADRQLEFMNTAKKYEEELRRGLYISRSAFNEPTGNLTTNGILVVNADILIETGGGVMNVFVGDSEESLTVITEGDLEATIRRINGEGLYAFLGGRIVKVGKNLAEEMETGWLKRVMLEIKSGEVELTRKRISLFMESTWSLEEKLGSEAKGLVKNEGKGIVEIFDGAIEKLRSGASVQSSETQEETDA